MTTFKNVKLGTLIDVRGGKRLPSGHELTKIITAHPYIRARDIGEGTITFNDPVYIEEDTFSFIKNYTVGKDDVCITIVGANVGDIGFVPNYLDGANLTENAVKLIPKNNSYDRGFLKYCLLTKESKLQMKQLAGGGAAQPKLGIYKINELEIPCPKIEIQSGIASILFTYDNLIENNNNRIKCLEEITQLIYTEWFVKFKFPGHEKVKMIDNGTEYSQIPEGWTVTNIVDSNIFLRCKERITKFDGEKLYFDTSCIDGINIIKEPLIVYWDSAPSRAQFYPVNNSVWFARMSNTYKVLVFDKSSEFEMNNYILSSGMLGIKTQEKYLGFLFAIVKSELFHQQKDTRATGATQVSLTDDGFSGIKILFPTIDLIEKYSNIVNGYIKQILALQRQNNSISKIRDHLIPQLVTGKRERK